MPSPSVTQILYPEIDPALDLGDVTTDAGKAWSAILDTIEDTPGFERLYWGRRHEEPEKVQLHIVRPSMDEHREFLVSPAWLAQVLPALERLMVATPAAQSRWSGRKAFVPIRHAELQEFTPGCLALGRGPPTMPIGTAIYLGTDETWDEGAWPLWTHVVRYVKGCRGVSGGKLEEPVNGYSNGYLVYVAWDSVKDHDDYHHTKHFRDRYIILRLGNKGYAEYGHVLFQGGREKGKGKGKEGTGKEAKL